MTTTKLSQEGVKTQLERFGVDTSKLKGLNWGVIMGQLEADELLDSVLDNDAWREWVDYLLEEHPAWQTPRWRRRKNAEDITSEYYNDFDNPPAEEVAQSRFVLCEKVDIGYVLHCVDTDAEIAEAYYHIANEEHPGWVEYVFDLEADPSGSTVYDHDTLAIHIEEVNNSAYRAPNDKPTENGFDRLWVHAINQTLIDREVEGRITDIDHNIWDTHIGPMIDAIEDAIQGPIGKEN